MGENIQDLTQFLCKNFDKIYNFDYNWTTMVTNRPAIFNDIDYVKCLNFIDNDVTTWEIEQYKLGNITELYHNFETLLVCNLKFYDRIINYATMIFYNYVRIGDDILTKNLDLIVSEISMTVTKLYCCALTSTKSTLSELEYAWDLKLKSPPSDNGLSPLEYNWKRLYDKSINFKLFMQYNAARVGTNGFRETWLNDKTSNRKLSQVCQKFTNKTNAIDESQLNEIFEYYQHITNNHRVLINSLRKSMDEMFLQTDSVAQRYAVYIFNNEFYLHSIKFSMRVEKSPDGNLIKEYLANSHECFIAESYLTKSMQEQINWVKYEIPQLLLYQRNLLQNLLYDLLKQDYRDIICYKYMYGTAAGDVISKIKFSGIFGNVYIIEELILEGRIIKTNKICKSKFNAAQYIIDKGYVIFGNREDVNKFIIDSVDVVTNEMIINHFNKYCKPIITHMFDVVNLYQQSNNDIIDVLCTGNINPEKFNNINIRTSVIKSDINPLKNITKKLIKKSNVKSYWRAIE